MATNYDDMLYVIRASDFKLMISAVENYSGTPSIVYIRKDGVRLTTAYITYSRYLKLKEIWDLYLNVRKQEASYIVPDLNCLDSAASYYVARSDFKLMISGVASYSGTPKFVYIRKDGTKQSTYVTYSKYLLMKARWDKAASEPISIPISGPVVLEDDTDDTDDTDDVVSGFRVGYFFEPTVTTPSTALFKTLKENGITDIFFRITSGGSAGWKYTRNAEAMKMVQDAGLGYYPWTMGGDSFGVFSNTEDVIADGSDGLLLDLETYNVSNYETTLKEIKYDCGTKPFIVCIKPTGWDGDQKYDMVSKYADYIMPMAYIGDYGQTVSTLASYIKGLQEKYPGQIMVALETYESDKNPVAKSSTSIGNEVTVVKPNSAGVALFRYGLSNYSGGSSSSDDDTTTKSTTQLQVEEACGTTFSNFTQFYNWVVKYCDYSYYLNAKFTWQQELDKDLSYLNCVDFTQAGVKLARAMGYTATAYGIYCTTSKVNHAIFKIKGNEFTSETWIDLSAAAHDSASIGTHWCSGTITKEPSWIPYE